MVGLDNYEDYYIECKGARKAQSLNYSGTRKSGHLARKINLATIDRMHNDDIHDCGSKHCIIIEVKTAKHLKYLNGRHYYLTNAFDEPMADGKMFTVSQKDKHLIGQKIALRSPITCAAGNEVCRTCYGTHLSNVNKNLNTGILATLKLTNLLTQRLLSAKHLLTTHAQEVKWPESFKKNFNVDLDTILAKDNSIAFELSRDNLCENEDEVMPYIRKITAIFNKNRIDIELPVDVYLTEQILKVFDSTDENVITFNCDNLDFDNPLFTFINANNELTESLMKIMSLLETNSHNGAENDYNKFAQQFLDLLIENNLAVSSIQAEMIASTLIRKPHNLRERPDFSQDDIPDYVILRLSSAIMNGPLATSLSFERLPEQLVSLSTYIENVKSSMDGFFK